MGETNIQLLRKIKTLKLYKEWFGLFTDPKNPLTVEQIRKKYRKSNGKQYTRAAIYKAFRVVRENEKNQILYDNL